MQVVLYSENIASGSNIMQLVIVRQQFPVMILL